MVKLPRPGFDRRSKHCPPSCPRPTTPSGCRYVSRRPLRRLRTARAAGRSRLDARSFSSRALACWCAGGTRGQRATLSLPLCPLPRVFPPAVPWWLGAYARGASRAFAVLLRVGCLRAVRAVRARRWFFAVSVLAGAGHAPSLRYAAACSATLHKYFSPSFDHSKLRVDFFFFFLPPPPPPPTHHPLLFSPFAG